MATTHGVSSTAITDNPFDPFAPLHEEAVILAADRSKLVERIVRRVTDPTRGFLVVSGRLGVGKSTLLRVLVRQQLLDAGWQPTIVVVSSALTLRDFLVAVAVELGYGLGDTFMRLGIRDRQSVQQEAGTVDQSSHVTIVQTAITNALSQPDRWSPAEAAAALQSFAAAYGRPLALLVDQTEHMFAAAASEPAIGVVEAIARAVAMPGGSVGAVVAIRDDSLFRIVSLGSAFPHVSSDIVVVDGLTTDEAAAFVQRALAAYGASFSPGLLNDLLRRLGGLNGTVWPIALHACCRELADVSKRRRRPATLNDLRKLGDLSGVLASVLQRALYEVDPPGARDALFCLYVIADVCRHESSITLERLMQALPAFAASDVARMVNLLKARRFIEEFRSAEYRLAHDAVAAAVYSLRHETTSEEVSREVDRAVALWAATDTYVSADTAVRLQPLLAIKIPTPHLVLLGASLFAARNTVTAEWLSDTKAALRAIDGQQLASFVTGHAMGRSRAALMPAEVFVLAAHGSPEAVAAAAAGLLNASRGPVTIWREGDYRDALVLGFSPEFIRWLSGADFATLSAGAARVIIRALLATPPDALPPSLLRRLWAHVPETLRPDLLTLAARTSEEVGHELVAQCLASPVDYLRAAAVDAARYLSSATRDAAINTALDDKAVTVRRRAIFAIGDVAAPQWDGELIRRIGADPSALVRESCLEILGRHPVSVPVRSALEAALRDEFEFVRESAVYASARVLQPLDAAMIVKPLVRDQSPKVREAALRIIALAEETAPLDALISDFLTGASSLRIAAAELLALVGGEDVDAALKDLLEDRTTDRDTLLAAIRLAARRRSSVCVPSLLRLIAADDVEIVCETIVSLGNINPADLAAVLQPLSYHPSVDVRERVVYALAETGGDAAVEALVGSLADPSPEIRTRAIYALGRLGARDAMPTIELMFATTKELSDAIAFYRAEMRRRRHV